MADNENLTRTPVKDWLLINPIFARVYRTVKDLFEGHGPGSIYFFEIRRMITSRISMSYQTASLVREIGMDLLCKHTQTLLDEGYFSNKRGINFRVPDIPSAIPDMVFDAIPDTQVSDAPPQWKTMSYIRNLRFGDDVVQTAQRPWTLQPDSGAKPMMDNSSKGNVHQQIYPDCPANLPNSTPDRHIKGDKTSKLSEQDTSADAVVSSVKIGMDSSHSSFTTIAEQPGWRARKGLDPADVWKLEPIELSTKNGLNETIVSKVLRAKHIEKKVETEGNTAEGSNETKAPRETTEFPALFPLYLPFPAQHMVLSRAQWVLENTCFAFAEKNLGGVIKQNGWDCPERIELDKWCEIFESRNTQFPLGGDGSRGLSLPTALYRSMTEIRNVSVSRTPISTARLLKLLQHAERFVNGLEITEHVPVMSKLVRITQQAIEELADTKHELEARTQQVFAECREKRAALKKLEEEAVEQMLKDDKAQQKVTTDRLTQELDETIRHKRELTPLSVSENSESSLEEEIRDWLKQNITTHTRSCGSKGDLSECKRMITDILEEGW